MESVSHRVNPEISSACTGREEERWALNTGKQTPAGHFHTLADPRQRRPSHPGAVSTIIVSIRAWRDNAVSVALFIYIPYVAWSRCMLFYYHLVASFSAAMPTLWCVPHLCIVVLFIRWLADFAYLGPGERMPDK